MCLGFGPDFPNKNKTIKKRKSVQSIPSWCGTPFFIKLPGHASLINLIISPSCVSSNYFQTVEATEVNVILSLSAAFWKISSRCCFTEGSVGSQSVYIYISLSVYIPLLRGQFLSRVFFGGKICEKNINLSTCSLPEANSNSPLKNQWLVQINFLLVCSA